jgi:hypothetical protein
MKKKSGKKLNLLKSTVSTLNDSQKNKLQGGQPGTTVPVGVKGCSRKLTGDDTEVGA